MLNALNDSDFIEESFHPCRKTKQRSESKSMSRVIIKSDYLLPDSVRDECYVCNKDLKHLNDMRKSLHVNNCLDQQERTNKFETKQEKWRSTIDCPICGEPLAPGPFRATHAKRCGQKHNVNPKSLLLLMDTQTKVAEAKKRNGTAHTKLAEPKLIKKRSGRSKEESHSVFDEQVKLATALSASLNTSSSSELSLKMPQPFKVRSGKEQSSFMERQPCACKCAVIEKIQENFLKIFKTRDQKQDMRALLDTEIRESEITMKDIGICLRKLNRLEQLVDDLNRFAESSNDITILSRENEAISACRFVIAARAPAFIKEINSNGLLLVREYSAAAIRSYIRFLTSASMNWTENEREEVLSLALKFGPRSLAALCKYGISEINLFEEKTKKSLSVDTETSFTDLDEVLNNGICSETNFGVFMNKTIVKGDCSSAKIFTVDDGEKKKEKEMEELEDSSIIFVEERTLQKNNNAKQNICASLATNSENQLKKPTCEIRFRGDFEIAREMPVTVENQNSEVVGNIKNSDTEKVSEEATVAFPVADNFMINSLIASSSSSSLQKSFSELEHFEDSFESVLKKLSPFKLQTPLFKEQLSSPFAFPKRSDLLHESSLDDLAVLPASVNESGRANVSKLLLSKTKSSPAFPIQPCFDCTLLSPNISPISVYDRDIAPCISGSLSPATKKARVSVGTCHTVIPQTPKSRLIQRLEELDSNIKILKTKSITPMPNYDFMSDKELRVELAKFGVRPMGRKKGTALLKRIYEETHPVLDRTPLSSKRKTKVHLDNVTEEKCFVELDNDEDCDSDKALNKSLDERDIMEESYVDEQQSAVLPKDLEGMQRALVNWLRQEENSTLYNLLLGLNVISFEEFVDRLSHADSIVSRIPKKTLVEILDRLHVTFRMPADGWERKRKRAKK